VTDIVNFKDRKSGKLSLLWAALKHV